MLWQSNTYECIHEGNYLVEYCRWVTLSSAKIMVPLFLLLLLSSLPESAWQSDCFAWHSSFKLAQLKVESTLEEMKKLLKTLLLQFPLLFSTFDFIASLSLSVSFLPSFWCLYWRASASVIAGVATAAVAAAKTARPATMRSRATKVFNDVELSGTEASLEDKRRLISLGSNRRSDEKMHHDYGKRRRRNGLKNHS